jgi:hypothetical protein
VFQFDHFFSVMFALAVPSNFMDSAVQTGSWNCRCCSAFAEAQTDHPPNRKDICARTTDGEKRSGVANDSEDFGMGGILCLP